jgi:hypothetical protein
MSDPRQLRGRCYCGAVGYEVADAFLYAGICHCSQCRLATGAASKPFAGIEREKLRVSKGADNLLIVGDALTHDTHCRNCGSLLFSVVQAGTRVHVAMGSLVDAPTIRPTEHIFVDSRAAWDEINDDLPQYAEFEGVPKGR